MWHTYSALDCEPKQESITASIFRANFIQFHIFIVGCLQKFFYSRIIVVSRLQKCFNKFYSFRSAGSASFRPSMIESVYKCKLNSHIKKNNNETSHNGPIKSGKPWGQTFTPISFILKSSGIFYNKSELSTEIAKTKVWGVPP